MNSDDTSTTDPGSDRKPRRRRPLENGAIRYRLIRELAMTNATHRELGEKYGVAHSAITQFAARHSAAILEVREDSENEFAGILFVKKGERLAEYARLLSEGQISPDTASRLMRNVAEELGALPNRLNVQAEQTVKLTHEVVGVDPEALK